MRTGPGRKPLEEGVETIPVTLRLTPTQKAKYERLGGGAWVRKKIDQAKEPKS